jgi:putative solute:sodium symporter small subunit
MSATAQTDPVRQAALCALRAHHWRRTRELTVGLLLLWLSATFGAIFFARELAQLTVFGWPLSFYLAAQGVSLLYLAIVASYAWHMRKADRVLRDAIGKLT